MQHSAWDLWRTEWHWTRFCSDYVHLPCQNTPAMVHTDNSPIYHRRYTRPTRLFLSLSLFFSVSLSIEITNNWYTASYSYVIAIMSIHTLILKVRPTYVGMQWRKVLSNFTKVFYSSAPQTLQCQMELSISDIYVLGEKNTARENSQNEQMLTILCWFVSHA
jgi:hypothetical protein